MTTGETPTETAERHLREAEARVAQQEQVVARLRAERLDRELPIGEALLANLRVTCEVAREHLRIERERHGG